MANRRPQAMSQLSGWRPRLGYLPAITYRRKLDEHFARRQQCLSVETIRSNRYYASGAFPSTATPAEPPAIFSNQEHRVTQSLDNITPISSPKVLSPHETERRRQQLFQTQFDPPPPNSVCCRRAFHQQYVATTLKAVVKTIKFAACLGAPQTFS